jgi:anti-sigma factor RsiW
MSEPDNQRDTAADEELVAYLDGELEAEAARRLDARLAEDAELREKLQQHQRAWDLLDELPRTDVGEQFTQTTVEMVAVSVADQVDDVSRRDSLRAKFHWLIGSTVAVVALLAGYVLVASIVATPNRQLVEDLRVIENLDEYRAVEEIEFLRALEREGLFVAEVGDGQ